MLCSTILLTLVPLALASPFIQSRTSDREAISVVLHKTNHSSSIRVYDETATKLYGAACSNLLDGGAFEHSPVSYNVNSTGAGNLTVGTEKYLVHEDPSHSGGAKCIVVYNRDETMVSCTISLPPGLLLSPIDESDLVDCAVPDQIGFLRLLLSESPRSEGEESLPTRQIELPSQEKRQAGCQFYPQGTELVGNGNSYRTSNYRQLSETINCGSAVSCSVGVMNTESVTISWSIGIGKKITEWISGGFSVSTSWTTGNNYNCQSSTNQQVCIWYKTAHTAYSVRDVTYNTCTGLSYGEVVVLRSPNINNAGGQYYCVAGQGVCHTKGNNYWDNN